MRTIVGSIIVVCALSFGCKNKLSGDLTVDGEPFELASCRSGQVYGFAGVELVSKEGAKLRIEATATGEGRAILMPANAATGVAIGACGPFELRTQNSTINNIKNVAGKAELDCEADGHAIAGTVSFENCH